MPAIKAFCRPAKSSYNELFPRSAIPFNRGDFLFDRNAAGLPFSLESPSKKA